MGSNLLETRDAVKRKIQVLFDRRIDDLLKLWKETFEEDICIGHLEALVGHVDQFVDEVYDECKARKTNIVEKIKELRHEANELNRLLQVDIQLNVPDNAPLLTVRYCLDQNLDEMRKLLQSRKNHIYSYLEEQHELVKEMDEVPRPLPDDPLPSELEMQEFRRYLDDLKIEKDRRLNIIQHIRERIIGLIGDLGIQLQAEADKQLLYGRELLPTRKNINKLEIMEQGFAQQYDDMKLEIDKYRNKLEQLWDFLQISPTTTQKFKRMIDYNQDTYVFLFEEYNRCEAIKKENIEKYVQKVRREILNLWDICHKSQEERDRFTPFSSEIYNEDLLTLHEMELAELKNFYEQNRDIFELYEARNELLAQMQAIDQRANDKNRYNNRGGQLLKEERERKKINSRFPKIEDQLMELCQKYSEREHKEIMILGKPIKDIILEDHTRREEEKNSRKRVGSTTSTPMNASKFVVGHTPQTGSALRNLTRNNVMSANRTASTTKLFGSTTKLIGSTTKLLGSTTHLNVKRKLSPASSKAQPVAKRNLLPQMTQTSFLRPQPFGSKYKSPAKGLKRQSLKRQSIKTSKRLSKKRQHGHADSETSTHSESISYDLFEDYVTTNTPLRSSVLPSSALSAKQSKITNNIPCITLSRANSNLTKSPSSIGSERKKLTTKNIPLLF